MAKDYTVVGVPRIRIHGGMLEIQWDNPLPRIISCGTNHQAVSAMHKLRLRTRSSHIHILHGPDREMIMRAADLHRYEVSHLPCMIALPQEEMKKALPWMKETAWLHSHQQLSREYLWQFISWAAKFHHPDRSAEETLYEQMCQRAGEFGIIDRENLRYLRDRYQPSKDSDGWYSPRPDKNDKIICLHNGSQGNTVRLLCVIQGEQWASWSLGQPNPRFPSLHCVPLSQGSGNANLYRHALEHMQSSRRWYQGRKLYTDHLSNSPLPYGVRTRDPHLTGIVRVGATVQEISKIVHEQALRREDWHQRKPDFSSQDYENNQTLQSRAACYGITEEPDQIRARIADYALQNYACKQSAWSRPLSSCHSSNAPQESHTGKLEALTCQSLPSGLVHPGMPGQASRLHGNLVASVLYRPLNPFRAV